jgi:hypothetical protein
MKTSCIPIDPEIGMRAGSKRCTPMARPSKKRQSLPYFFVFSMSGLVLAVLVFLGVAMAVRHYIDYDHLLEARNEAYREKSKDSVRNHVVMAIKYIEHMTARTESRIKAVVSQQVSQALAMATAIYTENRGKIPNEQIGRLIVEPCGRSASTTGVATSSSWTETAWNGCSRIARNTRENA